MRTRAMRLCAFMCGLFVLAALFPGLASADMLPTPSPVPQSVAPTPTPPADAPEQPPVKNLDGEAVLYGAAMLAGLLLVPLLLTIAIEMPVVLIAGRGSKASWKVGVLVNTLSNPAAVLFLLALGPILGEGYGPAGSILVGAIEVAVVVAEWRVFRWVMPWSNRKALATSLVANALSFGIGLAIVRGF